MYHTLPEELRISFVTAAVETSAVTKKSNNLALKRLREAKLQKVNALKQAGIIKAQEEFITCFVYHLMWKSERCWKTAQEVRDGLESIKFVKDQVKILKDNIQI